jgi:NADH dehydrogenase [ubiquinone] 1 alpha subcomplex assembly factor 5
MTVPRIFDATARAKALSCALRANDADAWLLARAADDICERLAVIRKPVLRCLLLGLRTEWLHHALPQDTAIETYPLICDDMGRMPVPTGPVDAIMIVGGLDTIDDLPGCLVQLRRMLTADGVLIAACAGAGSLPTLRTAMAAVDPQRAHFHPQIDVRAMGDLMLRAGFAQPVIDTDDVSARYSTLTALRRDLKANALGNVMNNRTALTREQHKALCDHLKDSASDGRFTEQFVTIHITGWATPAR